MTSTHMLKYAERFSCEEVCAWDGIRTMPSTRAQGVLIVSGCADASKKEVA